MLKQKLSKVEALAAAKVRQQSKLKLEANYELDERDLDRVHGGFPDVTRSPAPPATPPGIPIPYPNTAQLDHTIPVPTVPGSGK